MNRLLFVVMAVAVCAACTTTGAAAPAPVDSVKVAAPPTCEESRTACTTDADCVVSSTTCCACAMGGDELALRKGCESSLPGKANCEGTMCAAVYRCTGATAKCTAGQCTLVGGAAPKNTIIR